MKIDENILNILGGLIILFSCCLQLITLGLELFLYNVNQLVVITTDFQELGWTSAALYIAALYIELFEKYIKAEASADYWLREANRRLCETK